MAGRCSSCRSTQKYHWGRAAIQVAFSIFVLTETWLVPVEGWFVDRFGPKIVVLIGGILVGIAWVLNAIADSLTLLYIAAAIGGIGAGAVYGTCIGNALKWFPDRRGLCAGLTAAGFGAGSALTIIPIQQMIASSGYEAAFLWFGLGQGIVVVAAVAAAARAASPGEPRRRRRGCTRPRATTRPWRCCAVADLLGDVRDVRAGRRRRADGDGAARADRQATSRSTRSRSA